MTSPAGQGAATTSNPISDRVSCTVGSWRMRSPSLDPPSRRWRLTIRPSCRTNATTTASGTESALITTVGGRPHRAPPKNTAVNANSISMIGAPNTHVEQAQPPYQSERRAGLPAAHPDRERDGQRLREAFHAAVRHRPCQDGLGEADREHHERRDRLGQPWAPARFAHPVIQVGGGMSPQGNHP